MKTKPKNKKIKMEIEFPCELYLSYQNACILKRKWNRFWMKLNAIRRCPDSPHAWKIWLRSPADCGKGDRKPEVNATPTLWMTYAGNGMLVLQVVDNDVWPRKNMRFLQRFAGSLEGRRRPIADDQNEAAAAWGLAVGGCVEMAWDSRHKTETTFPPVHRPDVHLCFVFFADDQGSTGDCVQAWGG